MIENIKMLLEIDPTDTSQDKMIYYYIDMCTSTLLNLIKLDEIPIPLESCVERKVYQIMTMGLEGLKTTQIDRGDYKVKYEFSSGSDRGLYSDMLGELKPYLKKVKFI